MMISEDDIARVNAILAATPEAEHEAAAAERAKVADWLARQRVTLGGIEIPIGEALAKEVNALAHHEGVAE
jgi:hypothetical protein